MAKQSRSDYNLVEKDSISILKQAEKNTRIKGSRWRHLNIFRKKRVTIPIGIVVFIHIWLHLSNPYAALNFVQQPFTTQIKNGVVTYEQHFSPVVFSDAISDFIGYYRQGFLIVQNTLFGGSELTGTSPEDIIDKIHTIRFDPNKPYLISGDQFSVLYTRNLGVFYNQLLDPNTAHDKEDWEDRQRIYLQSVLYAIEGLSAGDTPRTTLVPIGPRAMTYTTVHPGDYGSDTVYGLLYAMNMMNSERVSDNGNYRIQTNEAIQRILQEKKDKLRKIVDVYLQYVQNPDTKMVRTDHKLAAARDGVSRAGSMYDNIVLWKTLQLANTLGIKSTPKSELDTLKQDIKATFWDESLGYYHNDTRDTSFSSDWLIGFPTGFFDLKDSVDLARTERTVAYIESTDLTNPMPIKYQIGTPNHAPFIIRHVVPDYGGEIIWSYWGAQYITLLTDLYDATNKVQYTKLAEKDITMYNNAIMRDGGFAETFTKDGQFLRIGPYKSIRVTGWVVQFEHAVYDHRRSEQK